MLKFTGTGTRSSGLSAAIQKQWKLLSLEPAKRVTFIFDPFREDSKEIRKFMEFLCEKKPRKTNPLCKIQAEVVCDRRDPTIDVALTNGETLLINCTHLDTVDLSKIFNKYITPLAPKKVETEPLFPAKLSKTKQKRR